MIDWLISLAFRPDVAAFVGVLAGLGGGLLVTIWFERKAAARVQMRVGPLHVSPRLGGFLQLVADGLKVTFQELIIPRGVDKPAYILAPILAVAAPLAAAMLIPLSPEVVVARLDYGVLVAVAILVYSAIFLVLTGWASNNRFAFIGAVREGLLVAGYELPLVLSVLSMVVLYGTADPVGVVEAQRALPGALLNPLAFLAYVVAVAMATARFPFEIADCETDVILGPITDYSSGLFLLGLASLYVQLYAYSLLGALLFLGGWLPVTPGPWPTDMIGHLASFLVLLGKALAIMLALVFLRAAMPVVRLDHALSFAWRGLVPLASIALIASLLVKLVGWV